MYRYELTWEIAFLLAKDDWEYGFSPLYRWGTEKGRMGLRRRGIYGAEKGRYDILQAGAPVWKEVPLLPYASLPLLLTRVWVFWSQGVRGVLRSLCQRHSGEALVCGCLGGVFEHECSPTCRRLSAYGWVWVLVPPRWRGAPVGTCSSGLPVQTPRSLDH